MTDTINDVTVQTGAQDEPAVAAIDEQGVAEQLVAQAREKGIELSGPGRVVEPAHETGAGDRARGGDE